MAQFKILSGFLCAMGLFSECTLSLEAETGENVTIWCKHGQTVTSYIFWFKHTNDSVPLLIGCKKFRASTPTQNCYFYNNPERMMISVQGEKTSLTITALNISDTGLYYCSTVEFNTPTFRNSTYLHVKGVNKTHVFKKETGCSCFSVIFMMNVVFGSVVVILLCVLIFILLKHGKSHQGVEAENKVVVSDSVQYVALQFRKKQSRIKRRNETTDANVIYSSVMQSNVCS